MKAAVLTEYGRFEWQQVPDPDIGDSQVLVRVAYAGVCGSDQHVWRGEFHPRTSLPLISGHEFAGTVVAVGKNVTKVAVGDRVAVDPIYWCGQCPACRRQHWPACRSLKLLGIDSDGGFAELVAADPSMCYPLPAGVSDRHGAMVELLSIGFHANNRAGVQSGDSVAIYGGGRVGQSILQAARTITAATIVVVDVLDGRLERVRQAYPDVVTVNARTADPVAAVMEATGGDGSDVVFEAVGHAEPVANQPPPMRQAVQSVRPAGTVCVLGLADDPVGLLMKELIWKEATLTTSRVSHGEFADAIAALAAGRLNPDAMISAEMPAAEAQQAFELLEAEPEQHLKILLVPQ